MIKVELPNKKYKNSFILALKTNKEEERHMTMVNQNIDTDDEFYAYLERLENQRNVINLKTGYVADTHLWVITEGKYIGTFSIRHELTPALNRFGGHIGYFIVEKERKKGYATEALKQTLQYSREILNLDKVLITCYNDNIASNKVIQANGGVLKDKILNECHSDLTCRYWIDL